jgi:hypothetical protein
VRVTSGIEWGRQLSVHTDRSVCMQLVRAGVVD